MGSFWGAEGINLSLQSPPELGDLGGEKDLCVHGTITLSPSLRFG
jgi:hypothetical protein